MSIFTNSSVGPLLSATGLVAIAEIGDKTQLLAFVLAARLKKRLPIVLGILCATILNHALAGSVGAWVAQFVPPATLKWIIAASFFAFALWSLKPDTLEEVKPLKGGSVFWITLVAFFWVEMGDKTQFATVALAAHFDTLLVVVGGTTLGMMMANVPAVWLGERLASRVRFDTMRWISAGLFLLFGIAVLAL